jgi:REP element-mobilizing transposase RayT
VKSLKTMVIDVELPKRKNIRLREYDYSQKGAYFVTICTANRQCILGDMIVGQGLCSCRLPILQLSGMGVIVQNELLRLTKRYSNMKLDKYVIMPNHIHAIIIIAGERQEQSPCPTVCDILCAFKSITTKSANKLDNIPGRKIWQFRFNDHIIRNEQEYQKICEYIETNPLKWQNDCYYQNYEE